MKAFRRLTKLGIRGTILFTVMTAAIIPATILTVIAIRSSAAILRQEANTSLLMQAQIVGQQVDSAIGDRIANLVLLANDRRFLVYAPNEHTTRLTQVVGEGNEIVVAYQLDSRGQIAASAGLPAKVGVDTTPYWETVSNGGVYFGDCTFSSLAGRPTIVMAAPIVSTYGTFSGALVEELDMSVIQAILDKYRDEQHGFGRTGYAYIINNDGLVIAHEDRSQIMSVRATDLGIAELTEAALEMRAGREGTAVYEYHGVEALVAYKPMKGSGTYGGNGWAIAAKFPTTEVYEGIYELQNLMIICALTAGALAIVMSLIISARIARPIVAVSDVTGKIASGDLSVEVPDLGDRDEIGMLAQSMRTMVAFIKDIVSNVQRAAEDTVSMSEELTAAASESAKGMEQVSASFQQVAAGAVEQSGSASNMAAQVDSLATSIREVFESGQTQSLDAAKLEMSVSGISASLTEVVSAISELVKNAQENVSSASMGQKATVQTVGTMERISKDTSGLSAVIVDLGQRSEEIGRIVDVITDIASQTNLLALNAAIEAARAGEYGRGFAVVADEVRKLAEDSTKEAKLISSEVTNIRKAIESVVRSVNTVADEVKQGSAIVADAGAALETISNGAAKADSSLDLLKSLVGRLQEAVDQALNATGGIVSAVEANAERTSRMADNAGRVRELVDNVAAISEENAASVQVAASSGEEVTASTEGIAKAADTLINVATSLRDIVAALKLA